MSDQEYRDTLNLLNTDFPMQAQSSINDPIINQSWNSINLAGIAMNYNKGNKKFIYHDGPPYANGHLHLGHAYNKILKDITTKSRRALGYHVPVIPGWDCHGLPIEQKVCSEKKFESPQEVKAACRSYAKDWVDTQRDEFKKLGVLMDWDKPYITMDYSYEAGILKAFAQLVKKDYIKRSFKTVPWCFHCGTTLAYAEIEYKERKDPSIYVLFSVHDQKNTFFKDIAEQIYLVVWTTTPWTLPLNRGVMIKNNAEYALLECEGKYLMVGYNTIPHFTQTTKKEYVVKKIFKSSELKNTFVNHPFDDNRVVPLLLEENGVDDKEGTACVHTAPGCGPIDYEVGVRNGLEIYSPVSGEGKYTEKIVPQECVGMSVVDAQGYVIKSLAEKGRLWHKGSINHSYPHCWRCRNGLIFRATPQWFFDLEKHDLKNRCIKALDKIKFYPQSGINSLEATLENRWEWCLSRQRVWGVPIPALINPENPDDYVISVDMIEKIAAGVEKQGTEFWDGLDNSYFVNEGIISQEQSKKYKKESDILDVWFDSAASNSVVLSPINEYPASLYLEGIDQFRAWFQVSLLVGMALHDKPPMEMIVSHGFTVDEKGQKMSKSLGNVMAPQEVIDKMGTDGLRLWVAGLSLEGDAIASKTIFNNVIDVYRKVRNISRFMLQNCTDFVFSKDAIKQDQLLPLDAYAVQRAMKLLYECYNAYFEMDFPRVVSKIAEFSSDFLSTFYCDILKDTLYCELVTSHKRRSAQTALWIVLDSLNNVIAPVLSYMSEALFKEMVKLDPSMQKNKEYASVHVNSHVLDLLSQYTAIKSQSNVIDESYFSSLNAYFVNEKSKHAESLWSSVRDVREQVCKATEVLRNQKLVKQGFECAVKIEIKQGSEYEKSLNEFMSLFSSREEAHYFLADICLVSLIEIVIRSDISNDVVVDAQVFDGVKCPRCWKWHKGSELLCGRCAAVLELMKK